MDDKDGDFLTNSQPALFTAAENAWPTLRIVNANCPAGSVMIVPRRKTIIFFLKLKKEMGKTSELSNSVHK